VISIGNTVENYSSSNCNTDNRIISKVSESDESKNIYKILNNERKTNNNNEKNIIEHNYRQIEKLSSFNNYSGILSNCKNADKNFKNPNLNEIYVLCLDDDQIFLRMLDKKLKGITSEFQEFKFHFIFTNCLQDFFNEFLKILFKNIVIDFFIMDQNISQNMRGIDCCRIVNEFYKLYFKDDYENLNFHFFFVTEEMNILQFKIMQSKKNLLKKDHIFGKLQLENLLKKFQNYLLGQD